MHRKAQTATEYLIILAVVIIIALIVVGVMGGIPGIGGGAKGRASQAYWSTADIAFPSYSVDTTDGTLNVRNNLVNTIRITDVDLGGNLDPLTDWTPPLPITLTSGQSQQIVTANANVVCDNAGDSFSYTISIAYTDTATGTDYTFTGEGTLLEGTCGS